MTTEGSPIDERDEPGQLDELVDAAGDAMAGDPLGEQLRRIAATVDPVPDHLLQLARESFTWRSIDAELAELAFDSVVDSERAVQVRGGGEPRLLTFAAGELTVEVEIIRVGSGCELVGQLVPPRPAAITVRHRSGTAEVTADDLGRFLVGEVATGPMSLRLRSTGGAAVVTDWVSI